jgi:hypothetical protein
LELRMNKQSAADAPDERGIINTTHTHTHTHTYTYTHTHTHTHTHRNTHTHTHTHTHTETHTETHTFTQNIHTAHDISTHPIAVNKRFWENILQGIVGIARWGSKLNQIILGL